MIVIQHNYNGVSRPDMTDSFIIRSSSVKHIWDIDPGKIGFYFNSEYDRYKYKIVLEGKHIKMLAKDFLKLILENNENVVINGSVKII